MSQGDYIRHKISAHKIGDLPSVLGGRKYAQLTRYQLANSITNTKPSYQQLLPEGKQNVFGSERMVSGCPEFILCENTNTRPNRVAGPGLACRPHPAHPIYVKQPANAKTACQYKEDVCKYTTSQ